MMSEQTTAPTLDDARREFAAAWLAYQDAKDRAAAARERFEQENARVLQAERDAKAAYELRDDELRGLAAAAYDADAPLTDGVAVRITEQALFDAAELTRALAEMGAYELLTVAPGFGKWATDPKRKGQREYWRDEQTGEIGVSPRYNGRPLRAVRIVERPTAVITPRAIVDGLRRMEHEAAPAGDEIPDEVKEGLRWAAKALGRTAMLSRARVCDWLEDENWHSVNDWLDAHPGYFVDAVSAALETEPQDG